MSDYIEYLHDVFARLGPITTRKMFGGYGVYHDGLMFALIADDTLYLKADSENTIHFENAGLGPFEYDKNGKRVRMSYFRAPDEIMDDRETAALWARRSFEAALRSQATKNKPVVKK